MPDGEPAELYVVNGRIRTTPVADAQTVAEDGYLLPGLVDAHCHVGLGENGAVELDEAELQAQANRDAGALLLRDCGSPVDTSGLQRRLDLPRLVRAGRHIARPRRYIRHVGVELEDPSTLPQVVAEQAEQGDGWVKLVGDWIDRDVGDLAPLWSDELLTDAIDVAHRLGARVTAHVFSEDALPGLIRAGIDCIEHGTGLTPQLADEMAARGTALVPTMINTLENFPTIADSASKFPVYSAHMRELYARASTTLATAIEAGVPVYAGTDAGGGISHGRIVDEIQALHAAGLSATDAIGAASWNARLWLGYLGLADYAAADLLVYDSDPRKDLGVLRKPRHIVLRGRMIA